VRICTILFFIYLLGLVAIPWYIWQKFQKEATKNRAYLSTSKKTSVSSFNSTKANRFEYEPLIPDGLRSVRLVTLLAGLPNEIPELECRIRHYALDQCPPYEALSYCWGDSKDRRPILCNGACFNVSANLWSALADLRLEARSRLLWIDAISINQDDLDEKAQQVSIMSLIYSQASRSVIWLGEATADSPLAFSLCTDLTRDRLDEFKKRGLALDHRDIWGQHPPLRTRDQVSAAVALLRLLKRPWFERTWIVQELGLAAEAVVTCGKNEMDWDALYYGFLVATSTGALPTDGQGTSVTRLIALNAARQRRNRSITASEQQSDFLILLMHFRWSLASDPRDKVYGFYGLAHRKPSSLEPSYHSTVTEVYKEVAIAILETTRDLRLFSASRGHTKFAQLLPSWVPDWSDSTLRVAYLQRDLFGSPARIFTASKGTESSVPIFNKQRDVVLLSGHIVDKIVAISAILVPVESVMDVDQYQTMIETGVFAYLRKYFEVFFDACQFIENLLEWEHFGLREGAGTYPTGEDHMTVYWRTLFADRFSANDSHDPNVFLKATYRLRYARLMCKLGISKIRFVFYLVLFLTIPATLDGDNTFGAMIRPAFNRRLARSEKGLLALVPQLTMTGDSIGLLKGGSVPLILRARSTRWELVGDTYVHGIMYGEAFAEEECKMLRFV
jgi:hypothetical protein